MAGFELFLAQTGQHPPSAKPLRGLGSGTLELIENFVAVYVLHAFKKKSKRGSKTPKADIELIKRRPKIASEDHVERFGKGRER
ncbi:MAG TPA: type II toxin-antitoxin system RelE/ParE family toxin [Pseudolabrys sp.]|nr:type II toxin-antitoxin system RelE/ParE family toxin [Pseudolabrys sp.]